MELILLDIKGVLCQESRTKPINKECIKLSSYYVVLRPGLDEFLKFCYDHYTVGFFSSTTKKNAKSIIDKILTPEQASKTHIRWTRSRTRYDPKEKGGFDTIKMLEDLFANPKYNDKRLWDEFNTLLIDDSLDKARFNKAQNVIIVAPYNPEQEDTTFKDLMKLIPLKMAELKKKL